MTPDITDGWEALTILTLVPGVIFMMMSLNGPMKQLRIRKSGVLTEGTVVETQHAPAENFRDHKGHYNGWQNGGWCAVYSYRLADGRIIKSTVTFLAEWEKRPENIVIGERFPLYYNPANPLNIHRADLPLFDGADVFFCLLGFLMIAAAIPFWPKSAAAGIAIVAAYFALRSGRFAKEVAK